MRHEWAGAAAAMLVLSACAVPVNGHPAAPAAPGRTSSTVSSSAITGQWSGTTSQGKQITFAATDGTLTDLAFEGRYAGSSCPITRIKYTLTTSVSVVNGHFSHGDPATDRFAVEGIFDTDRSATGTAQFVAHMQGCESITVTWRVTRSG